MKNREKHFTLPYVLLLVCLIFLAGLFGMFRGNDLDSSTQRTSKGIVANAESIIAGSPRAAEIIYSNLNGKYGDITYSLQVWVNREKLLDNVSLNSRGTVSNEINNFFSSLSDYFSNKGYENTYTEEDNLLDITLAKYSSKHSMVVSNPERDGYETYDPLNGLEKWGFYRSTYSWTELSVFADITDTLIEVVENALMQLSIINQSDITYIYNYGTSISPKTIYSNSNIVYYNTKYEMHIHEFVMTHEDISSREITLSQKVYNSLGWNLTLIALTLFSITLFSFVKRGKSSKEN